VFETAGLPRRNLRVISSVATNDGAFAFIDRRRRAQARHEHSFASSSKAPRCSPHRSPPSPRRHLAPSMSLAMSNATGRRPYRRAAGTDHARALRARTPSESVLASLASTRPFRPTRIRARATPAPTTRRRSQRLCHAMRRRPRSARCARVRDSAPCCVPSDVLVCLRRVRRLTSFLVLCLFPARAVSRARLPRGRARGTRRGGSVTIRRCVGDLRFRVAARDARTEDHGNCRELPCPTVALHVQ
jgi:hypothetical protein